MSTTAIFGAGVMGEALLAGLLRSGWAADDVVVVEKVGPRAAQIRSAFGVEVLPALTAARQSDTIVLVVKPQDVGAVLDEIGADLAPGAVVISLAAGLTIDFLQARLPEGVAVVRAMPNTPLLVGRGMAAISAGSSCSESDLARAEALLTAVGKVVRVPEKSQDAVTAVSGSGPAYLFYIAEAMIDGGVLLGLPRDVATELAIETIAGAGAMLIEPGANATRLRENVTSPGGTTAQALLELDRNRVRAALQTAMRAARDRSQDLAAGS